MSLCGLREFLVFEVVRVNEFQQENEQTCPKTKA
jgi:hypothetical protein